MPAIARAGTRCASLARWAEHLVDENSRRTLHPRKVEQRLADRAQHLKPASVRELLVSEVEGDGVDHHEPDARAAAGGKVAQAFDDRDELCQVMAAEDVDAAQDALAGQAAQGRLALRALRGIAGRQPLPERRDEAFRHLRGALRRKRPLGVNVDGLPSASTQRMRDCRVDGQLHAQLSLAHAGHSSHFCQLARPDAATEELVKALHQRDDAEHGAFFLQVRESCARRAPQEELGRLPLADSKLEGERCGVDAVEIAALPVSSRVQPRDEGSREWQRRNVDADLACHDQPGARRPVERRDPRGATGRDNSVWYRRGHRSARLRTPIAQNGAARLAARPCNDRLLRRGVVHAQREAAADSAAGSMGAARLVPHQH
eukprot:scaffold3451_cov116-Isochrysis_galbana.AAC.7